MSRQVDVALLATVLVCALAAGCASRVPMLGDGPGADPPADLDRIPDAVPRVEPLRVGGPNKPYAVFGRSYVPMTADDPLAELGLASWYGRKFHGQPTSSGEPYDMYAMTAAHRTMPIPSYARVRNPANGREVIVRVNDRGPFVEGRVIDLSYAAATRLGLAQGVAPVQVERLTHGQIRAAANAAPAQRQASAITVVPVTEAASLRVAALDSAAVIGTLPAAGWWLQVGAFRLREGASRLQQHTAQQTGEVPAVAVFETAGIYRVQVGPYPTRDQAQDAAARLRRQIGVAPLLLEREPERDQEREPGREQTAHSLPL